MVLKDHLKKPPWLRLWHLELGALILLFSLISPYKNAQIEFIGIGNYTTIDIINVALGMVHRKLFPCETHGFVAPFRTVILQYPEILLTLNLRESFPETLWPTERFILPFNIGMDPGWPFLMYFIWTKTEVYTLGMVISFLKILHFLGILGIFALGCQFKKPLFAFFTGMVFCYSPVFTKVIYESTHYLFVPIFLIFVTLLLFWATFSPQCQKKITYALVLCVVSGILIATVMFVRSTFKFSIFPFALGIFIFGGHISRKKRVLFILVFLVSFLMVKTILQSVIWTPERVAVNLQKSHLFWHPIWSGLGEFDNPHGFGLYDRPARAYAEKVNPKVKFGSPEYEKILKNHILQTIRDHPLWLLKVQLKKIWTLGSHWFEFLPFGSRNTPALSFFFFTVSIAGSFSFMVQKKHYRQAFLIFPFFIYFAIPLVTISTSYRYNISANLGIFLLCLYTIYQVLDTRFLRKKYMNFKIRGPANV